MAGIVVDRPPLNSSGLAADSLFISTTTQEPSWQQLADSFQLSEYAAIRNVTWWGFYTGDNPPAAESMRIRFYEARAEQDLPGSLAYEIELANPSRIATGRRVGVGTLPREFKFTADIPLPFSAAANTTYWIEVIQLGDISTHFRWQPSSGGDSYAFLNGNVSDWQILTVSGGQPNLAFQLSTVPEPFTLGLIACGAWLTGRRLRGAETDS